MSLKRVLRILEDFGLAESEAEVYVYLAKKGPKRETDLSNSLKITKHQLWSRLKKLQNKGLVTATEEKYAVFSAISFEKVLDLFVKANFDEASTIDQNMDELLASWRSITRQNDR